MLSFYPITLPVTFRDEPKIIIISMNILLVHNYHRSGSISGDDKVFNNEYNYLISKLHNVVKYVKFNDDYDHIESNLIGFIKKTIIGAKSIWSWETKKSINKLIINNKFIISHFHNIFPLISTSAYYPLKNNNIPVIQTLHDYRFICCMAFFLRDRNICEKCLINNLNVQKNKNLIKN